MRASRHIIPVTSVVIAVAFVALAGPIDPPPGPVAPSFKTLTETEPRIAVNATNTPGDADSIYRISQPGSYYLAGNITGEPNKAAIEIDASDVTLDLMGFSIIGTEQSWWGIFNPGSNDRITVRNGVARGWPFGGLTLSGSAHTVENFVSAENASRGINLGTNASVRNCRVIGNGDHGINVNGRAVVVSCIAEGNATVGIQAGAESIIEGCVLRGNSIGILSGAACVVRSCTASTNAGNGIWSGNGSTVIACTALSNTGAGILTGDSSTVSACTARSQTGSGISVGAGSAIIDCTSASNGVHGFVLASDCSISKCVALSNTSDGIRATIGCTIRENTCSRNGTASNGTAGAGVHTTGIDNCIDSNHCIGNGRGIDVDTFGSIIVRNSCSANTTNWDLAADNRHGGISNVTAISTPAVVGLGGAPTGLTTSDPHANFSF